MWKKSLTVLTVVSSLVFVIAACGESNEDACQKFDNLCSSKPASTGTDADGGTSSSSSSSSSSSGSVTVSAKCDPNGFDKMDNASDVKDCIDSAKDCDAAIACLLKAKAK